MKPLQRIVDSNAFTAIVVAVILANALVLGLQTYPGLEREHGGTLDLLNLIFLAFFVVEISLRIASYLPRPWRFFLDGWNVFDFLAVGTSSTSSRSPSPSRPGCARTRPFSAWRGWRGSSASSTSSPTSAS